MRKVYLDTETTGFSPAKGDRVVELALLEEIDNTPVVIFKSYFNPQGVMSPGAEKCHGLSLDFLKDKPLFAEKVTEFLECIKGAKLFIHNAPFDVRFLDNELAICGLPPLRHHCEGVEDTLALARMLISQGKHTIEALCTTLKIDKEEKALHSAVNDTELLYKIHKALTGTNVVFG
jgi:DNA polymerase-3 subunit epsilon